MAAEAEPFSGRLSGSKLWDVDKQGMAFCCFLMVVHSMTPG